MNRTELKKALKEAKKYSTDEVEITCENDLYCVTMNGYELHTDDFDLAYERFESAMKERNSAA